MADILDDLSNSNMTSVLSLAESTKNINHVIYLVIILQLIFLISIVFIITIENLPKKSRSEILFHESNVENRIETI